MSNLNFFLHLGVLLLLQWGIFDHLQLHSYIYINIYIIAIYLLPYRWHSTLTLLFGFLLGLLMDIMNHTMGIHTVATTLLTYIRPHLLRLIVTNEQWDDIHNKQKILEFNIFSKYTLISTLVFNIVLISCEVFTFQNFFITCSRILCSTFVSTFFIILYYFLALKKRKSFR